MLVELDTYDWREAFQAAYWVDPQPPGANINKASFDTNDVAEIIAIVEGENAGDEWVACGRLNDGRYFSLRAWCDFTGWDCQSGGGSDVALTLDDTIRFGLTEGERARLGIVLDDNQ
jgi:hypothetical protein